MPKTILVQGQEALSSSMLRNWLGLGPIISQPMVGIVLTTKEVEGVVL